MSRLLQIHILYIVTIIHTHLTLLRNIKHLAAQYAIVFFKHILIILKMRLDNVLFTISNIM